MAYTVAILESALKQLQKLPAGDQRRIRDRIDQLVENPRPAGGKKLAGSDELWRIRSGDYRIIYTIVDKELLVTVVRVGNRQDVYRNIEALSSKPKPQQAPKPKKKRR